MSPKGARRVHGGCHSDRVAARSMLSQGVAFEERHDLEQYFWTQKTVQQILEAVVFHLGCAIEPELAETLQTCMGGAGMVSSEMKDEAMEKLCCLCTPTLGHAFWVQQKIAPVYDIDRRFEYLPGFRYFDLFYSDISEGVDHRIVVFDPPFFYIPMPILYQAVLRVVRGNVKAKLLIGFLKREESVLLATFEAFKLKQTNFRLEYASVKPNKWTNYALYSNVDLPRIKRVT
mmetsp:Transcript_15586/g.41971  ORF Transcript_15586/g.41971 Transcript_15586/m.41971 type:complete len:231 (+) Transcript_15586:54-746(+)|eukprot:CAMPEP_0185832824 /NCGR_PEP_ID=MMETSP1353-20130828/2314_1 /TAXON_ID=1077150 /ORGANISM="Erythrolobus australicus, Strain CCMP3124" /LENGTH=230 /DNA_ID=CAMNT_0028531051 /DNA_START=48 /DNA_END=740 /DNA_ORIENTATION=-